MILRNNAGRTDSARAILQLTALESVSEFTFDNTANCGPYLGMRR
jgi:hypothetical protein